MTRWKKNSHLWGKEGEIFLTKYIPFCQHESKTFCLIGDLPVSHKPLILEPCLILEKSLIVNSEI